MSILTIRHNAETRTLDLTWQMTAHDMEHALSNVAELKLGSGSEHPKADSLLNAYFMEHLQLSHDRHALSWKWIGRELEGESLFCYLEVDSVGDLRDLSVSNSLLQDDFADQQNLVHVEDGHGPVRSHTFIRGAASYTFTW